MMTQAGSQTPQQFLRIHIVPFEQGGLHFIRSPELNFVAQGNTSLDALVNFINMATASISVAANRGNLAALIQNTRTSIVDAQPLGPPALGDQRDIYLPIIPVSDARARPLG